MPSEEFCFKEEQRNKVVARGSCKTKKDFIFARFFFFFFRIISGGGNEPTESKLMMWEREWTLRS